MTRLSVVVPAYREAGRIGRTVAALRTELASIAPSKPDAPSGGDGTGCGDGAGSAASPCVEIVVVDDGSGDGTAEAARAAGADMVVELPQNRGKGAAVRAGVRASSGQVIAFTDADLAYPPRQIHGLLAAAEAGADMVIGNRRHPDTTAITPPPALRSLGSRLMSAVTRVLRLASRRDTQCGLKAFRYDAAQALFAASAVNGFAFDVELLFLADRFGLSLKEVPVEVTNTRTSTVSVLKDGLAVVRDLLLIRLWALLGRYPAPAGRGDSQRRSPLITRLRSRQSG